MFIELTFVNTGNKFLLNIDKIEHIEADSESTGAYLWLGEKSAYLVKESYEEVKALIEREVQAERGY